MTKFWFQFKNAVKGSYKRIPPIFKHPAFVASLLLGGLVVGIRDIGGLQALELMAYDQMIRVRPDAQLDPRLLVVTITEEDIRAQKRWPISDGVIAKMLAQLNQAKPKVIGLDLYRDLPQEPGHKALMEQLRAPNVVSIYLLGDGENSGVPAPPAIPNQQLGFSDFVLDSDAVVRRNLVFGEAGNDRFYSLALQTSLKYLATLGLRFQVFPTAFQIGQAWFPILTPQSGGYQNLDDRGYQILLNYRSAHPIARQVTLSQVLNGQVNPDWIQDKVVLIGTTAPSAKDLFLTPYNLSSDKSPKTPGVWIHAQMISQLFGVVLDGQPVPWYWPEPVENLWIWGWALVGGVLTWRLRHPFLLAGAVLITLGGLVGCCYVLYLQAGWIPLIPAAIALVGASVIVVLYKRFHEALHDPLTGLPNRTLMLNRMRQAITNRNYNNLFGLSDNDTVAVLFIGLDSFKTINDSFGHQLADQLLVGITQRLQACLRSTDQLARIGGDEFAILRSSVSDIGEVTDLADRLQKRVTLPFNLDGRDVYTTASVGIALRQCGSDYEPEALLRDAHTAMHRAKASGKARHEVFVRGMRDQVMTRLQLETDLRRAIERDEFRLYYQPLVSLSSGKIAGFEALLRWVHPDRGFVLPMDFIPVAEDNDLIIPMGQWVLQESCRQIQLWQQQFPSETPLIVSVNLSAKQFSQPNLVEQIEQVLQETGLDGRCLKLEITESIAMNDVEATIALLQRLKALQLQLSIDDFGTGYSSLSYLHRFPTDTIKVDRSFVSRMGDEGEDAQIVQTIIMLGHNLGMDIVAEGVETEEQLHQLRLLKCEYAQGYLFAQPVSVESIETLLKTDPRW